jgi:hypothetical protein
MHFRVIKLGRDVGKDPQDFGELDPCGEEINSTHITDFVITCTPQSAHYAWTAIMECYSEKHLMNRFDKLTAISGLADLVVEYLGLPLTDYLAGLWQDDITEGLPWYFKPGYKVPQKSQRYVAPSWSWAGIE